MWRESCRFSTQKGWKDTAVLAWCHEVNHLKMERAFQLLVSEGSVPRQLGLLLWVCVYAEPSWHGACGAKLLTSRHLGKQKEERRDNRRRRRRKEEKREVR